MKIPSVSIVIPTYNSEKLLPFCLRSIRKQDYPKGSIEIIIVDGGSVDNTNKIAEEFKVNKVIHNPLVTGESGKAIGVKSAKNDIVALIDSDNILPSTDWIKRMVEPFEDEEIVGTEPLYFTYRKKDSYINRYCALIGMNDPICLFLGNYDRFSYITGEWTGMKVIEKDKKNHLKLILNERMLPTMGANGFLIRRKLLKRCSIGDYLFDIDIVYELVKQKYNRFAMVKIGIVHLFSENIQTFVRKTVRRNKDYWYYKKMGLRKYPWSSFSKLKIMKFIVYTLFIIPLTIQLIKGWLRKRDDAWLFHIPACWISLIVHGFGTLRKLFKIDIENRNKW